jgi:hypothetical protein
MHQYSYCVTYSSSEVFWSFERTPHCRCGKRRMEYHPVLIGFTTMSWKGECFKNHEMAS